MEAFVNGVSCGVRLVPPYRFDVTGALKDGENALLIRVTNHLGYAMRDGLSRYLMMEPSGLLGPVRLVEERAL